MSLLSKFFGGKPGRETEDSMVRRAAFLRSEKERREREKDENEQTVRNDPSARDALQQIPGITDDSHPLRHDPLSAVAQNMGAAGGPDAFTTAEHAQLVNRISHMRHLVGNPCTSIAGSGVGEKDCFGKTGELAPALVDNVTNIDPRGNGRGGKAA
jgi:hypothetical protein